MNLFNKKEETYLLQLVWELSNLKRGKASDLALENGVSPLRLNMIFCYDTSITSQMGKDYPFEESLDLEIEWPWPGMTFEEIRKNVHERLSSFQNPTKQLKH